MTNNTPEELGEQLSRALKWDGNAIFTAMQAALIDSNFHTEAESLAQVWERPAMHARTLAALKQLVEAATHHQADLIQALNAARAAIKQAEEA
jgi:hypothetical protein